MKRNSYLVLSLLILPIVGILTLGQTKANAGKGGPIVIKSNSLVLQLNTHRNVYGPSPYTQSLTVDMSDFDESEGLDRPANAFFATDNGGNLISPSNGRYKNGYGYERSLMEACKGTQSWNTCGVTCEGSGGYCDSMGDSACKYGAGKYDACVSACNSLKNDSTICSPGDGGQGIQE